MDIAMISILLFGSMFLLLASGLPVAFVLGGLATIFTGVFWGPESLFIIVARTYSMMSTTTLVCCSSFRVDGSGSGKIRCSRGPLRDDVPLVGRHQGRIGSWYCFLPVHS